MSAKSFFWTHSWAQISASSPIVRIAMFGPVFSGQRSRPGGLTWGTEPFLKSVKAAIFINDIAPRREMLAKQQIKMEITFLAIKNCTDTRSETGAFRTHDLLCYGVGPPPLGQRVFCCQCATERVDEHLRVVVHVIITASHLQPTCVLVLLFHR
jgi:hypothetical protein